MSMDRTAHHHRPAPHDGGLSLCPECERRFVVPVALLDLVDEGLYLLALECKNCGRLAVGMHEDAEVERFERELVQAAAELQALLPKDR